MNIERIEPALHLAQAGGARLAFGALAGAPRAWPASPGRGSLRVLPAALRQATR